MKRILFSHSYFMRFDPKQWNTGQPYAPLGTLYAASLMREDGYEVALFDTMFAHNPEEVIPVIEKNDPATFNIGLSFSFKEMAKNASNQIAIFLKENEIPEFRSN